MDSVDPNFSFKIIDQPSNSAPGSMVTQKRDHVCNAITSEDVTFSPAATNREIENVHEEENENSLEATAENVQKIGSISSSQCPNIESENLEEERAGSSDQSSYVLLGPIHIEEENENSLEATAAVSTEQVLEETRNNTEPLNGGGTKSPFETPCTPIKGKETENTQPLNPQIINNTVNIPKPSGIGLHLNSIVNVLQAGSSAVVHVKSAQNCNFNIRGKKSVQTSNPHMSDRAKGSSVFTQPENVSECADDTEPKTPPSVVNKSDTSLSTVIIKPSNIPVDDQPAQGSKSVYTNIESDGISKEFKSNSTRKRKRSSDSGDGCKRCHCRKSKCLKLYCDCFAAGLYCAGSCACQGCYNRPEYEDKVLESRRQIESRNPLAFAPRIVKNIVETPASSYGEEETGLTPSSARHKRGCNCKKSMCLKKYCECYHANVGCSDGCRCEGCKNVHGRKGEHRLDTDFASKEGATEKTNSSFIDMMQSGDSGLCNELTPRTPAVQFFKNNVPEGCLRPKQHFQSPESRNSANGAIISEAAAEVLDLVSSHQELYYGNAETGRRANLVLDSEERSNHSKAHSSSAGSLSWLRSPGTPLAQSSTNRPLKAIDLDGELSNNATHDDTPDILKDSPTPLNAVKSSSPNKKRVSPPHATQHDVRLRSLNGLRSGRKFILKAVPSAPPQK